MTHSPNDVLLVHAYLDGELDPANALGIAQRMGTEPALSAEGERVKALQRLIHERLPRREEAPPGLRARIESSVGGLRRQRVQPSWRALAASIALTAMVDTEQLRTAIAALPTPFRETLVLRDIEGLDYREIAETTEVPIGTVMSRLARARGRLIATIGKGL
jgi:RNA polymerase sigma factor (sigma-70 family)